MQWLSVVLILVLGLVQSTWTMLAALAVRLDSSTVPEPPVSIVIEATWRMLECDVKVFKNKLHLSGYFVDYVHNMPCA